MDKEQEYIAAVCATQGPYDGRFQSSEPRGYLYDSRLGESNRKKLWYEIEKWK